MTMRVLAVEDDALLGDAVRLALDGAGFAVDLVGTAEAARAALQAEPFDLAIVDIGLPRENGLRLVQGLRNRGKITPILMLTARDSLSDRVTALNLGADDYMTKPFEMPELIARCRALIRRANAVASSRISLGRLEVDMTHKEATVDGELLALTQREWSILECLALNAGHLVSKDKLLSSIADWSEELTANAIEQYVSRLRSKLGSAARICAVRGMGYRFDDRAQ
ncbi:MAG: response regulator transcription factor [Woeseiaceae bacterium]